MRKGISFYTEWRRESTPCPIPRWSQSGHRSQLQRAANLSRHWISCLDRIGAWPQPANTEKRAAVSIEDRRARVQETTLEFSPSTSNLFGGSFMPIKKIRAMVTKKTLRAKGFTFSKSSISIVKASDRNTTVARQ